MYVKIINYPEWPTQWVELIEDDNLEEENEE